MERTEYARIADRYDQNVDRLRIPDDLVLDAIVAARGDAPVRALDLACGTGNYLRHHVARHGDAVVFVGLDRSDAMLAQARPKLPGVELLTGAAESLPFDAASFDYVTTSFAFHHFEDKAKALDEMARVLRARGTLRCVNVDPARMRASWLYAMFPETYVLDLERFWPLEVIERQLEKRGFAVEAAIDVRRTRVPLATCLADVERRELSQLDILAPADYERGRAALREAVRVEPDASVRSEVAIFTLVARR